MFFYGELNYVLRTIPPPPKRRDDFRRHLVCCFERRKVALTSCVFKRRFQSKLVQQIQKKTILEKWNREKWAVVVSVVFYTYVISYMCKGKKRNVVCLQFVCVWIREDGNIKVLKLSLHHRHRIHGSSSTAVAALLIWKCIVATQNYIKFKRMCAINTQNHFSATTYH